MYIGIFFASQSHEEKLIGVKNRRRVKRALQQAGVKWDSNSEVGFRFGADIYTVALALAVRFFLSQPALHVYVVYVALAVASALATPFDFG